MDKEIADRMRNENFEQFQTLVRMHLSFELDLNADPVDVDSVTNVKLRSKKLFAFPKKSKQLPATSKSPPFNVVDSLTPAGIEQLKEIIRFLMQNQNIIQEGIFRRTGSVARQNELRRRLNEQTTLDLSNSVYTVHDCASVLKAIIADLPEPLLTDYFYAAHCQIAELYNSNQIEHNQTKEIRLLHSIQLLLLLLPNENRSLFHDIINMLYETSKHEPSNKMSSDSLATLFTPHLICPRKLTPESLHTISQNMSGLISFMICKGDELQGIPPKLATDIRAYFVEQRRKKVLSPELQMLDESVTSDSTANTVYTFVDREKTAEAHNSNPTDTALAQLYAYIQTLPESSKKRKLIKQFNKENGHGTPLQQQMMMRLKKGNVAAGAPPSSSSSSRPNKSLSGSIKKHIFHSALGGGGGSGKTPKRGSITISTPSIPQICTPNSRRGTDSTPKSQSTFHTPVSHRLNSVNQRIEPFAVTLETPKSAMKSTTKCSENKCNGTDTVEKMTLATSQHNNDVVTETKTKNDRKDSNPRIKFVQSEDNNDAQSYQTPIACKLNKFMMCFKSEPDLSRCQNISENVPMLNRGRFIAKKLLSGVSMINLRRPFANGNEKASTAITAAKINCVIENSEHAAENNAYEVIPLKCDADDVCSTIRLDSGLVTNANDKIDVDDDDDDEDFVDDEEVDREYDDSVDKENRTPLLQVASTINYMAKLKHHHQQQQSVSSIGCNSVALSDSVGNDSVSPITKSTHRMSKAMQESIMTPRSRKPVIIGGMRGLATDTYHPNFIDFQMDDEVGHSFERCENTPPDQHHTPSLHRSKSESSLLCRTPTIESHTQMTNELIPPPPLLPPPTSATLIKSTSDETLSTPFRKYLFSRSLLMTTPVDSSFSSQSGDFENLNDSEMSESLIYCLNGNEPIEYVGLPNVNEPINTPRSTPSRIFSSVSTTKSSSCSIKRPLKNDDNDDDDGDGVGSGCGGNGLSAKLYGVDYSCINPKKNHLELDETAL